MQTLPSQHRDQNDEAAKRGYAKGYRAGCKRGEIEGRRQVVFKEQQEFIDRAFLAALPAAMQATGWIRGDKEIRNIDERVALASDFARAALKLRPRA